ncbi:hypothetical protein GN958_ATG17660, partial [Phytophthora infestans]
SAGVCRDGALVLSAAGWLRLPAIWAFGHGGGLVTGAVLAADGACGSEPSTLTRCLSQATSSASWSRALRDCTLRRSLQLFVL